MHIWGKGRAAGRVGSDFLSAIAGRVGSTFHQVGSGRVQEKVTRGQLCARAIYLAVVPSQLSPSQLEHGLVYTI